MPLPLGYKWRDILLCTALVDSKDSSNPPTFRPCFSGDFHITFKGELTCRVCSAKYTGIIALRRANKSAQRGK